LVPAATAAVAAERERLGDGLIAVIAPAALVGEVRSSLVEVYGRGVAQGPGALTQDVVALSADQAKGMAFAGLVLVEPGQLMHEAGGKVGSLYVALTRATQSLRVLAAADLPAGF